MPKMNLEDDNGVLVEWQPHVEKAATPKDKVFVKWSVGDHGRNEDLQDLEKDYLNISKLK